MKKKNFSWMPSSPALRALMQSPIGILAINWVFQGMRGMQRKELSFRILLEATIMFSIFFLLPSELHPSLRLGAAFVTAHTFNWLFNTHLWVCVRYFPIYRRDPEALWKFLEKIHAQLQTLLWLDEAVCIGSVGDIGEIRSERSDIDIRIIFGRDNWFRVNILLLRLRTAALFQIIPIDLYAYDNLQALDRFRQDEGLRILLDRRGQIAARYGKRIY